MYPFHKNTLYEQSLPKEGGLFGYHSVTQTYHTYHQNKTKQN